MYEWADILVSRIVLPFLNSYISIASFHIFNVFNNVFWMLNLGNNVLLLKENSLVWKSEIILFVEANGLEKPFDLTNFHFFLFRK